MNQHRLRRLKADFGKVVRIVSAHDPVEFEMEARRQKTTSNGSQVMPHARASATPRRNWCSIRGETPLEGPRPEVDDADQDADDQQDPIEPRRP